MRVLVLNPSSKVTKNVVRDVLYGCWCKGKRIGGGTVPPFALLSVATVLKKLDVKVDFIDAAAIQMPYSEQKKQAKKSDIIIISTSTMSFNEDVSILVDFKNENPNLKTIIFGSHPTFLPEHALSMTSVDYIILGEPEHSIMQLVESINNNDNYSEIPGIGFRTESGIKINKNSSIENLDSLPFLDVDMLPKDIHYFNPIVKRMPYITTTTSRGCPGKCTFCTAPFFLRFQNQV